MTLTIRQALAEAIDFHDGEDNEIVAEWRKALEATAASPDGMTDAARDVLAERRRQIEVEGWAPEHDDGHHAGEMAAAAAAYALFTTTSRVPFSLSKAIRDALPWIWRWDAKWFKPSGDSRRDLVKAGALLIAEIERLDRAPARRGG
jgi:hypothetical protein